MYHYRAFLFFRQPKMLLRTSWLFVYASKFVRTDAKGDINTTLSELKTVKYRDEISYSTKFRTITSN